MLLVIIALTLAVLGHGPLSAQDKQNKYTLKVPRLLRSSVQGIQKLAGCGPVST